MAKPTVLHLPTWYPNKDDLQLGIFIKNQIELTRNESNNIVLYIQGRKDSLVTNCNVTSLNLITTIHVIYPSGKNVFSRVRNYLNAVTQGLEAVIQLNKQIDLVHCHIADKNLWIAKKYFSHLPCILSEHWSGYLNQNFDTLPWWKKTLRIKRINNCEKVIAVSPHLKKALLTKGVNTEIEVIENVIQQPLTKKNQAKNFSNFLMVNDLDDSVKNISGVIKAFKEIEKERPNFQLTIIGDGKDKEKLETLITSLNLNSTICLKGRLSQENVLKEYANYDALIVNSSHETYSMVTAEALLAGLPVISTKCQGPEQFITKENGILIPTNNEEKLREAILELSINSINYSPENIRNTVKNRFSQDDIKDKIMKNYSPFI